MGMKAINKEELGMVQFLSSIHLEERWCLLLELGNQEDSSSMRQSPCTMGQTYVNLIFNFAQFSVSSYAGQSLFALRDLLSTHHSTLYPRRLVSKNCIKQALLTSGFRLGFTGQSRRSAGHKIDRPRYLLTYLPPCYCSLALVALAALVYII